MYALLLPIVALALAATPQTRKPIEANILDIIIATDGSVSEAKVLRSIPLLDQAAIATARQWRYEPTYLNGAPVPVIMTATVDFR